jgi:aminoglycoside phosphotransferase (APT) family kinase protein
LTRLARLWALDGAACGAPALLADRLPGRRPTLAQQRQPAVLRELGAALAAIHALDPAAGLREATVPYEPFYEPDPDRTPPATTHAGIRARARELVSIGPRPGGRDAVLHRDFHPGNTARLDRMEAYLVALIARA